MEKLLFEILQFLDQLLLLLLLLPLGSLLSLQILLELILLCLLFSQSLGDFLSLLLLELGNSFLLLSEALINLSHFISFGDFDDFLYFDDFWIVCELS